MGVEKKSDDDEVLVIVTGSKRKFARLPRYDHDTRDDDYYYGTRHVNKNMGWTPTV